MTVPYTGWPDLFVEIAPGDTPLTVSPTWDDATADVAWELTCQRGRFGSGASSPAGSMKVKFDDPDRDYDGSNTTGPNYPYIRPRLPVRFRATYSAVDYPLWRGHVTTPEHSYAPDGDDSSTFDCVDLFAVMATVDTSERSAWAATLENYGPLGWWRFGEETPTEGVEATDDTGRYHGRYHGTSTSVDGLVDNEQSNAVTFASEAYVHIDPNVVTAGGTAHTLTFRFSSTAITANEQSLAASVGPALSDAFSIGINPTGALSGDPGVIHFGGTDGAGLAFNVYGTVSVADGQPHTVSVTFTTGSWKFYIDGALAGSTVGGPSVFSQSTAAYPASFILANPNTETGAAITMDEVTLLPVALTAAQALDLHEAAADSWAGEDTGARIARAANLAGIPAGLQDIDTGVSTVVGWDGGPSTIDVAQEANETEQGILVVSGDGKLTFENRHAHLADASSATFGDSGADLTYCGHKTEQGEHLITNRATFTSPAGSGFAQDQTSIDIYGVHSTRRSTIDDNPANLVAGAQYLIGRFNGPEQRIVGLEIDPMYDPTTLWPQVLGRDIGDRIVVKRTPSAGSAISQTVVIVGIRHTLSPAGWRTYWSLSTADTASFAISDVSLSDGPAVAAF